MSSDSGPGPGVTSRLGYLFKHAAALLEQRYAEALAPYGIDARELGVLLLLAAHEPASQQHAANRLEVDRTTMVAVLDRLEAKGLVVRRPDPADRRRNVVALTEVGQELLGRAGRAGEEAERALLAPLGPDLSESFRAALQEIVLRPGERGG